MMKKQCLFVANVALLGGLATLSKFVALPLLIQTFLYTVPIMYLGAHNSLKLLVIEEDTEKQRNPIESVKLRDTFLFPVIGSGVLLTIYFVFKFFDPRWVNLLLTTYTITFGSFSVKDLLYVGVSSFIPMSKINSYSFDVCIHFKSSDPAENPRCFQVDVLEYLCLLVAGILGIILMVTGSLVLHNLFAIALSIEAISMLLVGNFTNATVILGGLFFYDIFWVFGTNVMETVAKSFDGPIKLRLPTNLSPYNESILGLGDIVIPGFFIALSLRLDYVLHRKRSKTEQGNITEETTSLIRYTSVDVLESFRKFYFWVVLLSYELGLATTGVVLLFFKASQPALLYLVPYCLFSLFGAAILNGEMKYVMGYDESFLPKDKSSEETITENLKMD